MWVDNLITNLSIADEEKEKEGESVEGKKLFSLQNIKTFPHFFVFPPRESLSLEGNCKNRKLVPENMMVMITLNCYYDYLN